MKRQTALILATSLSFGAFACTKQSKPLTASSAEQGPYALGYVDSLTAARTEVATIEQQVESAKGEFAKYPAALSSPNWSDVRAVYEAADAAGRSTAYVDELEKDRAVAEFYIAEKDELNRRVGGAVQYAAKQKECDVELTGPASYALGKAIDERIHERLHDRSEAHELIDEREDTLLKKNRPKLEEQADAISQTSYFVYVAAPKLQERLAAQVSESSTIDSTLARVAEDSHNLAVNDKASKEVRARATARETEANAARQKLAAEVGEAKRLSDEMEKRVAAARDKYDAAFDALIDDVKQRAKAEQAK